MGNCIAKKNKDKCIDKRQAAIIKIGILNNIELIRY